MKVLIYVNQNKDPDFVNLNILTDLLKEKNIDFDVVFNDKNLVNDNYSALFVIGGDGTILRRTEFSNRNSVPIIGINLGKLGFLSEFECSEINQAVNMLVDGKLIEDKRQTLKTIIDKTEYLALNDIAIQRMYSDSEGLITTIDTYIDDYMTDTIRGDGIIIATPTGSTAYSLSAGGAILAPGINAFTMTPIAAHSLSFRPVVFSSDLEFSAVLSSGSAAGLFIDGKFIKKITTGEKIIVSKAERPTVFLRKPDYNFFNLLTKKLKERGHF